MANLFATFIQYFRPYQNTPLLRLVKVSFAFSKAYKLVKACGVILCLVNYLTASLFLILTSISFARYSGAT